MRAFTHECERPSLFAHRQVVQAQLDRDQKIEELVTAMERIYSFIDVAGDWKNKIRPLESVMINIMKTMRECAEFIQGYASHKLAGMFPWIDLGESAYLMIGKGRIAHQTISQANATISSLLSALQGLEDELDRAVTLNAAVVSNEIRDNMVLELLKPANMDASTRQLCFDGTRVEIRKHLIDRLSQPNDSPRCEVIWLLGLAGSGKSTLMNSIAEHFRALRQCGAFVFFDRSDPVNSDPSRVIPTLAYHLAQFSLPFAKALEEQIQARRDIVRSSLAAQFQMLLEKPSEAVAGLIHHSPIIIVIDGLDECGTEDRREGAFWRSSQSASRNFHRHFGSLLLAATRVTFVPLFSAQSTLNKLTSALMIVSLPMTLRNIFGSG